MIANHHIDSSDQTGSFLPRELMLPAAVCALALAAILFAPTSQADADRSKGGAHPTSTATSDRDTEKLEAFTSQEPYRADFSTTSK